MLSFRGRPAQAGNEVSLKTFRPSALVFEARDNRLQRSVWAHIRYAALYWPFFLYWSRRSVVIRYSQTNVGVLWAILQPLLSSLVYVIVFSLVVRVSTDPVPYPLFILTGLITWTYFNRVVFSGAVSITSNLDIVTRVRFPREFLPLATVVESLVDLAIGLAILVVMFVLYQQPLTAYALIALWAFAAQTALGLGLAFFLAGLGSAIRDLFQVLPILLQLWLYLTPVLYPLTLVPDAARARYLVNPLAPIYATYQETLLYGQFTQGAEMLLATLVSLMVLFFGYRYFKRAEWRFADAL